MLTREQITANIEALEKQGAQQPEIQEWLDSLKTQQTPNMSVPQTQLQPSQPQPNFMQQVGAGALNLGKNIGGALISSEKKFGEDIGKSIYLASGGQNEINKVNEQNIASGNQLIQLAKKTADPVRKQKLLQQAASDFAASGMASEDIIGQIKSNRQYLGDAAGVLVDILSAGTYGSGANGMKTAQLGKAAPSAVAGVAKAVGTKSGIVQGAKTGLKTGAVIGGAEGIVGGMQEGETAKGIALSGLKGAGTGALIGGTVGAVAGGIAGKTQAKQLGADEQERALKSLIPEPKELSPDEYQKFLDTGRVTPKSMFGTAQIVPSNKEITLANEYSDFLQSRDPIRNTKNIVDEIINSDKEVETYLEKQVKSGDYLGFDKSVLKNNLQDNIKDITDIYVPNEKRLTKMKDDLVKGFIESLPEKPTLKDLWKARKAYDTKINSKINAFGGTPTLRKEISVAIRNGVQDFISEETGDTFYKTQMSRMKDLYDILDMVDTKSVKERGYSALKKWMTENPGKANVIKAAGGIGLTYLMYSAIQKAGGGQ